MNRPGLERRAGRHNARTGSRFGWETPSSKPGRWARKRDAAEGSRREHMKRGRGRNSQRPWDFVAHELPRANGKSPRPGGRRSVNLSPCGRRTSLPDGKVSARRLAVSIPGAGHRFQRIPQAGVSYQSSAKRSQHSCSQEDRKHIRSSRNAADRHGADEAAHGKIVYPRCLRP
jgi:hypothetical protein